MREGPSSAGERPAIPGVDIGEEIGRGASSVVYRARRGDDAFAVKIHHTLVQTSSTAMSRFRREASVLARSHHPGLPRVMEAGAANGLSYMIMELVEGRTLAATISSSPLKEHEAVKVGVTIAGALAAIHRHGQVHRDVKPQNVVMTRGGEAKLIDLGLVGDLGSRTVDEEGIAGTLRYSSPEQLGMLKRPVDSRADLYSLGALLFEIVTGRPPFLSEDPAELIRQHASTVPPSVRALRPELTPAFSGVVARLLAKDPDDRYQTATGLVLDLAHLDQLNESLLKTGRLELGTREEMLESAFELPLVGRAHELETLQGLWNESQRGEGAAVLLEGEPGSGKTRITRELLKRVSASGGLVLRAKCVLGDPMPFAPLREAVDGWLRWVARRPAEEREQLEDAVRNAAGEFAPLLRTLSPGLANLLPGRERVPAVGEAREQFLEAIAELLIRLGEVRGGGLLFLDDVQWMDDSSRRVIRRLSARLSASKLLVLCAARSDPDSKAGTERFRQDVSEGLRKALSLEPLGSHAVGDLVAAYLGGSKLPDPIVTQLAARSSGSPFAITEYLRAMIEDGLLRPAWGGWTVATSGLEQLALPTDVIQLVVKRLARLDERTRQVLRVAAVAGSKFEPELLARVERLIPNEVHTAIAEGMTTGLLERVESGEYAFVHDRVREALLSELEADERHETHQRLAIALDEIAKHQTVDLYALANHYRHGRVSKNPKRVSDACRAAGIAAWNAGAFEEAFGFLDDARSISAAASLSVDPQVLEYLGQAAAVTGRVAAAVQHLEAAIAGTPEALRRAEIRSRLAWIHIWNRNVGAAWSSIRAGFEDLDMPKPSASLVWLGFALVRWALIRIAGRFGFLVGTARGTAREHHLTAVKLWELAAFACYFEMRDDFLFPQVVLREVYSALRIGKSPELANAYCSYAVLLAVLKLAKPARKAIGSAIRISEDLNDRRTLAHCRAFEAYIEHFLGEDLRSEAMEYRLLDEYARWLDSTDYITTCGDLIHNLHNRGYVGVSGVLFERGMDRLRQASGRTEREIDHPDHAFVAWARSEEGDLEAGRTHFKRAWEIIERAPGSIFLQSDYWGFKTLFHLVEGELGAKLDEAIERGRAVQPRAMLVPTHARKVFMFAAYGRLAQAEAASGADKPKRIALLAKKLREFGAMATTPVEKAHLFALRGALARLQGKAKKAHHFLAKADTYAYAADCPWALVTVARERARMLLVEGNRPAALREARRASGLATDSGMFALGRRIAEENGVGLERSPSTSVRSEPLSATTGGNVALRLKRHLDALLQVSLASATVFDPDEQARVIMDEIVKLLAAERAFLFLHRESDGALVSKAGRDSEGRDLPEMKAYSRTVVEKVANTRQPMVVAGSDEGQVLGSESIVAHDIRSIVAAPLTLRERLLGVVYLDNRMAKGIFTEDDVEILVALSHHIAIALEMSRTAQVEMERRALEKDLALTAAVQSLFLPDQNVAEVGPLSVAGYYEPAARCGGDWWTYEQRPSGAVRVMLGDVTGHGPGPAMVTANVSAVVRTLTSHEGDVDVDTLLAAIHGSLSQLGKGDYRMTMSVVEISPDGRTLTWWSAGAPPLFIARGPNVDVLAGASGVLGGDKLDVRKETRELAAGDRAFLFTDGLIDLTRKDGRPIGMRKLRSSFATAAGGAVQVRDAIASELNQYREGTPLADDLTFVIVGVRK